MRTLVDSNVLVARLAPNRRDHAAARAGIALLQREGDDLCVTAQNIAEFWRVATSAAVRGGLDLNATQAAQARDNIERVFVVLPETAALYDAWKELVDRHQALGLAGFDIRLVAAIVVHRVDRILTFDRGLARYGVTVLDPAAVAMW